jgi:hypothetical protein
MEASKPPKGLTILKPRQRLQTLMVVWLKINEKENKEEITLCVLKPQGSVTFLDYRASKLLLPIMVR